MKNRISNTIFILFFIIIFLPVIGESTGLETVGRNLYNDFDALIQPGQNLSNSEGIFYLSAAVTTGALVWHYDRELLDNLLVNEQKKFKNTVLHSLSSSAYWYGSTTENIFYTWAILSAGLAGTGYITGDDKHYKSISLMAESVLFATLFTGATKMFLGRERPSFEGSQGDFRFFESNTKYRSMPSGHTALAFTFASVLSERYDNLWVKIPAYTLAVGAGLERIEHRHHWVSDVILGGLLGHYIGQSIVRINTDYNSKLGISGSRWGGLALKLTIPLD